MKPDALDECPARLLRGRWAKREPLCLWWAVDNDGERPVPLVPSQSAEQIAALCRSYNDTQTNGMEGPRESQDPPPRPLARHLSDADRLRKVIQELMDTEKSYVKVTEDAVTISCSPPVTASCMYVGRGVQVSAGDPATHEGDACSLKWRVAEGEGERMEGLRGLAKIRFPGRFVTEVAFTMETDVLVCHLQSVGREPVPV